MQDLAALAALHAEIDAYLEAARASAVSSSDPASVQRVEIKQRLNDQAYFVLCWGQMETAIDDGCRRSIRRKRGSPDWQVRRAWDLYNPEDPRLSGLRFEDRVGLLLDRAEGRGSPYARIVAYYSLRNGIAHGRLRSDRIDVSAVASDFYLIQSSLSH